MIVLRNFWEGLIIVKKQNSSEEDQVFYDAKEFNMWYESKKEEQKDLLQGLNYNFNGDNTEFLKIYYSLIFLLENKFENYNELERALKIEKLELKVIDLMVDHNLDFDLLKKLIKDYLSKRKNYFKKSFNMCESIVDVQGKIKSYINCIDYLMKTLEITKGIDDINYLLESSESYEK